VPKFVVNVDSAFVALVISEFRALVRLMIDAISLCSYAETKLHKFVKSLAFKPVIPDNKPST